MIWSCVQNIMGKIYADNPEHPQSVMALLGDFCFLAGAPAEELVRHKPAGCTQDFVIMIPQSQTWEPLITKTYEGRIRKTVRYATQKEANIFDQRALQKFVDTLPPEYSIERIDRTLYETCRTEAWSRDLVSQYADYDSYKRLGLGVVARRNGEIVSGASSYSRYLDGIEIEIDTKETYRRQGLACACGAKLILECLKQNLYPSWDAQNKTSLHLAKKLGYHFSHEYPVYEIYKW